ncbi:DNA-binding storekeeper transcriptional regulator [Trifolium pratense]|uniref:DNA-binding storekeeper transcriptional regulator n=1 Tax=Trifolium pratense TaxID=57577 RepID=A0A2K3NPC0_TRIPR|nr:DNA-binding storekeeper transcriptional regulator [Trifolium pratense]
MAAFFQNGVVSPKQEFVQFQPEYEEEEVEQEQFDEVLVEPDEINETEQSPSSAVPTVILALPNATAATVVTDSPEPKRDQMEEKNDSRKLFQRLWTDEDEIVILQGFLDYNANRGSSYHNDTGSFYDQIKSKIQLDFNKSQLVDKLRRLKKKYRNVVQKFDSGKEFVFKTPHDQATFEISHKIWKNVAPIAVGVPVEDDEEISPNPNSAHMTTPVKNELIIEKKTASRKRSRTTTDEKRELNDSLGLNNKDNHNNSANNNSSNVDDENADKSNVSHHTHNIPGLIEETVKSCLTPVLKELSSRNTMGSPFGFGGRGFSLDPMPFSFMNFGNGEKVLDDKWKKQRILELEVYSKRLELVQDEIKVALEELRSSSGAGARGGNNHQ